MSCSGGMNHQHYKSPGVLLCEEHSEERSGRAVSLQEAQLHMNQEKVRDFGKRDKRVGLNRHEASFWSLAHPKNDSLHR